MNEEESVGGRQSFGDRLKQAWGDEPSQAEIARVTGISTTSLSLYKAGTREPKFIDGVKLAQALSLDPVWLATGDDSAGVSPELVSIGVYDVRFAAGVAAFSEAAERIGAMPFDKALLAQLGLRDAGDLGVFTADGDSMWPTIQDGGRVLVNLADTRLREGVFAFRTGDELRVKRLRRILDGIEIISDNERYAPEQLTGPAADSLTIIGRVRWAGGPI